VRFALDVAPLGSLADPRALVRLGEVAEATGWDGFSTWDSLGPTVGTEAADPFLALAGVAMATERVALLASVIVLPRRRPQLVAQAAGTLDRLSGGRLVLGIGAGGDRLDFEAFDEPWDSAVRVARMDEAARLVDAFLRGETVTGEGPADPVHGVAVGPDRPGSRGRRSGWARTGRAASGARRAGTAGSR
jgi:alkanesulfonate monooxygenase SsuD/methylene tetrahydromethanopterin reductase-like flavin-dependent oxidoreductase (luciferase family)